MARYSSAATRAGINTANSPIVNLTNTGTTDRMYIVEIGLVVVVAPTNPLIPYLSRATARGTNTATLAGQAADPGDGASVGTLDSTWSANPTFSTTAFHRIAGVPVAIGSMLIWTFYDRPIVIDKTAASGMTLANQAATGATLGSFGAYFVWDE